MDNGLMIRTTSCEDVELLTELRMAYLLDQNTPQSLGDMELLKKKIRTYLESAMEKEEFVAVILEAENAVVSCAFLSLVDRPPRRGDVSCRVGTVYNVFTQPQYRNRGYAKRVMQELLLLAKKLDVGSVELLASGEGQPLYEKLGFQIPNHTFMRLKIK